MESLHDLSARQYGLLSRGQLLARGTSIWGVARGLERKAITLAAPAVYRLASAPQTWEQRVMAAVLWSGAGMASHRTAAALHGLDGCKELGVEISTVKQRHFKVPVFKAHRTGVPERLVVVQRGIRVTNVARTLSDLGTQLPAGPFGRAVETAVRQGLTSLAALQRYLAEESAQPNPGLQVLRAWIQAGNLDGGLSASGFQRRVRDLLKPIGSFAEEVHIFDPDGSEIARVDFGHQEKPVIVEADSAKHHAGRDDWYHDLQRRNRVTARGYQILHVTPGDLETAAKRQAFQALVRATLARQAAYPAIASS